MKRLGSDMPKFKNTSELHTALAQAAFDWIETDLAYDQAWGPELGVEWGSPIEERMFLGLAIAAQTNRYALDLYRASRDRLRLVLDDLNKPPHALFKNLEGQWERYTHIPKRIGYAPHNELDYGFASGLRALRVYEQVEIQKYRADMLVEWTWDGFEYEYEHREGKLRPGEPAMAVIECDGHDFHERTKEQARRDRRRDRDMQGLGLPVLRFTGSEIYANPVGCGRQVINFFIDALNRRAERDIGHAVLDRLGPEAEPEKVE